jgi:hypothetical protein
MSKQMARLEFEMPECCGECPLSCDDEYRPTGAAVWCNVTRKNVQDFNGCPGRPEWCPLREVTGND